MLSRRLRLATSPDTAPVILAMRPSPLSRGFGAGEDLREVGSDDPPLRPLFAKNDDVSEPESPSSSEPSSSSSSSKSGGQLLSVLELTVTKEPAIVSARN
jgi:hypothetical protein